MPFKDPEAKRAWRVAYNQSQRGREIREAWEKRRAADPVAAELAASRKDQKSAERKRQREISQKFSWGIRRTLTQVLIRA
jgi:hypothetical protein